MLVTKEKQQEFDSNPSSGGVQQKDISSSVVSSKGREDINKTTKQKVYFFCLVGPDWGRTANSIIELTHVLRYAKKTQAKFKQTTGISIKVGLPPGYFNDFYSTFFDPHDDIILVNHTDICRQQIDAREALDMYGMRLDKETPQLIPKLMIRRAAEDAVQAQRIEGLALIIKPTHHSVDFRHLVSLCLVCFILDGQRGILCPPCASASAGIPIGVFSDDRSILTFHDEGVPVIL